MSHRHTVRLLTLALLALASFPIFSSAQGPLTPPGAPAPSMASLGQIEPRIDVNQLIGDGTCLHLITQPGSYYLSANVSGASGRAGIAIASSNVVLDLRGFAINGVAGSSHGIEIRGAATANVQIRQGTIAGWDGDGIRLPANLSNAAFEDLTIQACGGNGIFASGVARATARRCRITDVKGYGINFGSTGTVLDCQVGLFITSGFTVGIAAQRVQNCTVEEISSSGQAAAGIYAEIAQGCFVTGITSNATSATGIGANTVTDCQVNSVRGSGAGTVVGISAATVTRCSLAQIGNLGGGAPSGIIGGVVGQCTVSLIGGAGSTGEVNGIAASVVSQCLITGVGTTSLAQPVNGISAAANGVISDCAVTNLSVGSAALRGIAGRSVARCRVSTLSQAAASVAGSAYAAGIEAEIITDSSVQTISGNHSTGARGFSNFRSISGCQVSGVSDGTGLARGMYTIQPALVERCQVVGGRQGLLLNAPGSRVSNCSFTAITTNGPNTGYGITIFGGDTRVENCAFADVNDAGVAVFAESVVVDSCSFGGTASRAVSVGGSVRVTVTRNRLGPGVTTLLAGNGAVQSGPVLTTSGDITSTNPWVNFRN